MAREPTHRDYAERKDVRQCHNGATTITAVSRVIICCSVIQEEKEKDKKTKGGSGVRAFANKRK